MRGAAGSHGGWRMRMPKIVCHCCGQAQLCVAQLISGCGLSSMFQQQPHHTVMSQIGRQVRWCIHVCIHCIDFAAVEQKLLHYGVQWWWVVSEVAAVDGDVADVGVDDVNNEDGAVGSDGAKVLWAQLWHHWG
ncbi:hypothetical protein Pelo_1897 [Pelomyxa schiedti]|nr:hypothetical protein Pelo_1897 [Pelomyxa schiedti]